MSSLPPDHRPPVPPSPTPLPPPSWSLANLRTIWANVDYARAVICGLALANFGLMLLFISIALELMGVNRGTSSY